MAQNEPDVPQRFIDLLNAPIQLLEDLAKQYDIPIVREERKWELARSLSQALNRTQVDAEAGEYLYAGSTSLSWYRFVAIDEVDQAAQDDPELHYPLTGPAMLPDAVIAALHEHSEGNPFDETLRPTEIDRSPKLVVAREWAGGYLLTFAVARPVGHAIHNFRRETFYRDEFFTAWLSPADGNIEVRSSATRARLLARTWLQDFAGSFDCRPVGVAITQRDWHELHNRLEGGVLDAYRGKKSDGTSAIDTLAVTRNDLVAADLLGNAEFNAATQGVESESLELLFMAPEFGQVRLRVSVLDNSIFIRTGVPESVIRYVRDVLVQIKN